MLIREALEKWRALSTADRAYVIIVNILAACAILGVSILLYLFLEQIART